MHSIKNRGGGTVDSDPEERSEQIEKIIVCDLRGRDCIKLGNGVILIDFKCIESIKT
jgi:hypothetical protein